MPKKTLKSTKKKNPIRIALDIVIDIIVALYLVTTIFLSLSVFSATKNDGIPSFFGYMLFTIQTDSMEDTINVDDLIISKKYDEKTILEKGEIITFYATATDDEGRQVTITKTHRIDAVETNDLGDAAYETRGDNAPDKDGGYRVPGDIIAVYTGHKISGGGKVFDFLQSQKGIMICLVIPLALFFFWALYKFVKNIVEYKYSKKGLTEEQQKQAYEAYIASHPEAAAAAAGETENKPQNPDELILAPREKDPATEIIPPNAEDKDEIIMPTKDDEKSTDEE